MLKNGKCYETVGEGWLEVGPPVLILNGRYLVGVYLESKYNSIYE